MMPQVIQQLADMMNYVCEGRKPLVLIKDNLETHVVALIAILANPDAYIVVPNDREDSLDFFGAYNVKTIDHLPTCEYIEFGGAIRDGDKEGLAYNPLDSYSFNQVSEFYLDLEHSNLLPY